MARRKQLTRTLGFQQLENRNLMAGNVVAAISNHSLILTGDNHGNDVLIAPVAGKANLFLISSFTGTTTFNGKSSLTFTFTGNLSVNFKDGNDRLHVGGTPGGYMTLPGSLNVVLGRGKNEFDMSNTTVSGNLSVSGGAGQNAVFLNTSSIGSPTVNGGNNDANFNFSQGIDLLTMNYTPVERDLIVNEHGESVDVSLMGGRVGRNTTINGGIYADNITINEYYFAKALKISTGGGDDRLVLGETISSVGRTTTTPNSVVADSIFADLGSGNDTLRLGNVNANTGAVLNGNAGIDSLYYDAKTGFNSLSKSSFEYQYNFGLKVLAPA